jgi:hypothetical protein
MLPNVRRSVILSLASPLFAVVLGKMLYVEDTPGAHEIEVANEDEAQHDVPDGASSPGTAGYV